MQSPLHRHLLLLQPPQLQQQHPCHLLLLLLLPRLQPPPLPHVLLHALLLPLLLLGWPMCRQSNCRWMQTAA
jgi:hypothetical protein